MALQTWSETTGSTSSVYWSTRQGKKQIPFDKTKKPPLAYFSRSMALSTAQLGAFGRPCGSVFWGEITPLPMILSGFDNPSITFSSEGNDAYARAYAKFKDKVYSQAATLTALSERIKTVDMVLARLVQLKKGASALKKGRFKEFLDTFGVRPLKKHEHTRWTRPKQFGALWLEYWMGWAPTVGDVYTCIEALERRIPDETIRAGSRVDLGKASKRSDGSTVAYSEFTGYGIVWVQGQVEITNPSLHIAQTLGLLNPFKTLWETTAFSWFADWFTNVGQLLGQFTDWVGLKLKNLVISAKTAATSSWLCLNAKGVFGPTYPDTMFHAKEWFWFSRHVGGTLPLMKPVFRLPNGLSLSRGATLASLLATMFAPSRR